jgi:hypothetical protein
VPDGRGRHFVRSMKYSGWSSAPFSKMCAA